MYITDPLEILESQIECMMDEFDGKHCMQCGKETEDFMPLHNHPASPAVCGDCIEKEIEKIRSKDDD